MKLIWQNKSQEPLRHLKLIATRYVDYVDSRFSLPHEEVAITISTRAKMKEFNHTFRGKNEATDVLTFPGDESYLGDIIICYAIVVEKAQALNMTIEDYFIFTVVHGLLHALGYDHQTQEDYDTMMSLQDDIIQQGAQYERTT